MNGNKLHHQLDNIPITNRALRLAASRCCTSWCKVSKPWDQVVERESWGKARLEKREENMGKMNDWLVVFGPTPLKNDGVVVITLW